MSLSHVSLTDFRQALVPEALRSIRVIYSALAGGIAIFTMILLYLYGSGSSAPQGDEELVGILSLLVAVAFPAAFFLGKVVTDRQYIAAREGRTESMAGSAAARCVSLLRTTLLIRAALIEGATYFALAVITVSITDGIVYAQPVYLFNFVYPFLVLAYFAATFPTAERLEVIFQEKIVRPS